MSVDLKEKSIALLSTTTVSLAAAAATTLYTVPAGKKCFLHCAVVEAGADAGASTVTIGQVGALTDFLGTQTISNLDASGDVVTLMPVPNATPAKAKSYAAATVIQMNVTGALGGATNYVYLYGTLADA